MTEITGMLKLFLLNLHFVILESILYDLTRQNKTNDAQELEKNMEKVYLWIEKRYKSTFTNQNTDIFEEVKNHNKQAVALIVFNLIENNPNTIFKEFSTGYAKNETKYLHAKKE